MTWHVIRFTNSETASGKSTVLRDKFSRRWTELVPAPVDMVLLTPKEWGESENELYEFYLTPTASSHCHDILVEFGATPCPPPDIGKLKLSFGDTAFFNAKR